MKIKVPVLWVPAEMLRFKGKEMFGICGEAKRIFKVTKNTLEIIVINDIFISPTCEEERRCLNVKCPLNHSTAKSLKMKEKMFKKLPIEDHWPHLTAIEEKLCQEYPDAGILFIKGGK